MAVPEGLDVRGIAARRQGQQAARVHGVERYIGLIRGVDGGPQLRLVFLAGARDAAREVDHVLAARHLMKHGGQGFDGRQFLVRIENVELGFIRSERVGDVSG